MSLNKDQQNLLNDLKLYLNSKTEREIFGVLGAGGTGKTFTLKHLNINKDYLFLAPTNKAVDVIKKSIGGSICKIMTVDKYFGYQMIKDHENKTEIFYEFLENPPKPSDLPKIIVVDECSMLRGDHSGILYILSKYCKIIVIGDEMQLPPINDELHTIITDDGFEQSSIFNKLTHSQKLTIPNRQDPNSNIYKMISEFRSKMNTLVDFSEFVDKYVNNYDVFRFPLYSNKLKDIVDQKSSIGICYKKQSCIKIDYIFGRILTKNKKFSPYEKQINNTYIFDSTCITQDYTFYSGEKVLIKNIYEDIKIVTVPVFNFDFSSEVIYGEIESIDNKIQATVILNYGDLIKKIQRELYKVKSHLTKKQLSEIYTFISKMYSRKAYLKNDSSITIHKSQGSTYNEIIIPLFDFSINPNKYTFINQLFYVAISRAKSKIYFVDGVNNFSQSVNRVNFTEIERGLIASRYSWRCPNCNINFDDVRQFDVDHIIPLGSFNEKKIRGDNTVDNLQPLCKKCHKLKHKNT